MSIAHRTVSSFPIELNDPLQCQIAPTRIHLKFLSV